MYSSIILEKCLNNFDISCEKLKILHLLKFCNEVCGERGHQYLVTKIEDNLAECLEFEKVCVLNYEGGRLFSLKRMKNDMGEILVQGLTELPLAVGITGKALTERATITSVYGKTDIFYDEQIDNILKLRHLENIMVIPLLVSHRKGKIINYKDSTELELVGALQLINGDLNNINKV